MDFKHTKLTLLLTTIIATGCSANKLDSKTDTEDFCRNGGQSSDYSCDKRQQTDSAQTPINVNNPNTEAWMNSKLSDIKIWLKTIKENPDASTIEPSNSNTALMVRNPAATDPELILIETLTQNGAYRDAMAAINIFLAKNPDNLEAELTKGLVLSKMGQEQEAEVLLRNSITRHPTSPELYNNLAVIYSNKGNYGKAIETLLLAFSTHPSYAQVNENLREVYASVASSAYNRALDLDASQKLTPKLVVLRRISIPSLPAVASSSLSDSIALNNNSRKINNPLPTAKPKSTVKPLSPQKPASISTANTTLAAATNVIVKTGRKEIPLLLPTLIDPEPEPEVNITKLRIKPKPSLMKAQSKKSIVRVDNNATKKIAKAPGSSSLAAIKAVNRWSWTWTSQNVNAYLGSYVKNYSPSNSLNHSQWKQQRTERLTKPSFIKIKLSGITAKRINNNVIELTFLQSYQANTYKDQTKKRLTMVRIGTQWLISKEQNI